LLIGAVAALTSTDKPHEKAITVPKSTTKTATVTAKTQPSVNKTTVDSTMRATAPQVNNSVVKTPSSNLSTPTITPSPVASTCTKGTYQPASVSNTPSPSVGLQEDVDQPQYYVVYGYTASQIRAELNQCSPVATSQGDFDAETSWWLKFTYDWYTKSNGLCALQNVGVVAHVTFMYPQWTNTAYSAAGLNAKWQTYMTNLTTHEQGHKTIALQYANTLLTQLQSYPDTTCTTIEQSANSYGNGEISALTQAENNYDTQTDHGATQGATFP
jgi:predicted secreted Zn-dependent protease